MKSIYLIFILGACLVSCQTQKPASNSGTTFNIDLTENVERQGPSLDWIEDLQFIPLETNPDCYISRIKKLNLNQSHIVIYADQTVHLYTRDGKHLKSFKRQGKGPGEYGDMQSIDLVPDRDEIMGVDLVRRKILCYNFAGNLSCEINTPSMPVLAAPLKGDLFACCYGRQKWVIQQGPDFHMVDFIDREGHIVSQHLPFKYQFEHCGGGEITCSGEPGVYFLNPIFSYDIIQMGPGDRCQVKYRFDFGNFNIDTLLLTNEKHMMGPAPEKAFAEKKQNLDHLAVTTNTISFWGPVIQTNMRFGWRQVNRKSGHIRFIESDSPDFNGVTYAGIPLEFPTKSSGDYFVLNLAAIDLLGVLKKLSPVQKQTLSRCTGFDRLTHLKEDDNPVLILYKVKDF